MSRPRILLADDHTMFSQGLQSLLEDEFELGRNCVGWAGSGRGCGHQFNPDVIIVDISMPVLNGFRRRSAN